MDSIQSGKKKYIHKSLKAEILKERIEKIKKEQSTERIHPPAHPKGKSHYSGRTYSHD